MSRTSRTLAAAALLAVVIGVSCWWLLRSSSTGVPQDTSRGADATAEPDIARPPSPPRRTAPPVEGDDAPQADEAVAVEAATAVAGVVLDRHGGSGIAGAHVEVLERDLATEKESRLAETVAGGDGTFRIEAIPGGRMLLVSATAPRRVRAEVAWDSAGGQVELVLPPAGILRGIVRDALAVPVAEAWVRLSCLRESEMRVARTGEGGRFEVDGIRLGTPWDVHAWKSGHVGASAKRSVLVDETHPEADCEITLGRVARIGVRVLNPDGTPAASARIQYGNGSSGYMERTDGDGTKTLEVGEPGTWSVLVDSSSATAFATVVEAVAGETREVVVRLAEGDALTGVVVDDLGKPVAGAWVFSPDEPAGEPNDATRSTDAKADGSFRLTGVGPGEHLIAATAPGYGRGETSATAPGADVRIVVARGGRVTLRLVLPPGATVPERRRWQFTPSGAGSDGDARRDWPVAPIDEPLGPGTWDLDVAAEGYAPARRTFEIRRDEVTALGDIALVPGLTLTGRVVDVDGKPVAGAFITHQHAGNVQADAAGRFAFRDLPAGPLRLTATQTGFVEQGREWVTCEVKRGAPPVTVVLHRPCVVEGSIRDSAGTAPKDFEDLEVIALGERPAPPPPDGERVLEPPSARVWDDGSFTLVLPPGRWRVQVLRGKDVIAATDVDAAEGGESRIELTGR